MTYRQVRGFDLLLHAVDPSTGGTLCGLPSRKVADKLGGTFRPGRAKTCVACEAKASEDPRGRRSSGRPGRAKERP